MDIESWFDSELQILTEIRQKVGLELVQENYRFLMSTFQSTSVRISIDFNNFWPVVTLFHNFLGFHMILTSKYCDSDEEFIKNSPLLNAFSNSTPDSTLTHTWLLMGETQREIHWFWPKITFYRCDWFNNSLTICLKRTLKRKFVLLIRWRKKISLYPCMGYENK